MLEGRVNMPHQTILYCIHHPTTKSRMMQPTELSLKSVSKPTKASEAPGWAGNSSRDLPDDQGNAQECRKVPAQDRDAARACGHTCEKMETLTSTQSALKGRGSIMKAFTVSRSTGGAGNRHVAQRMSAVMPGSICKRQKDLGRLRMHPEATT